MMYFNEFKIHEINISNLHKCQLAVIYISWMREHCTFNVYIYIILKYLSHTGLTEPVSDFSVCW